MPRITRDRAGNVFAPSVAIFGISITRAIYPDVERRMIRSGPWCLGDVSSLVSPLLLHRPRLDSKRAFEDTD